MTDSSTPDLSVLRATMREKAGAATHGLWTLFDRNGFLAIYLGTPRTRAKGGKEIITWSGFDGADTSDAKKAANAAHIAACCPQNVLAVLAHDDAEIARLTERAEAAERERDEARGYLALLQDSKLHGRVTAAEARVVELEQALREFTRLYEENIALRAARLLSPEPNTTPDGGYTGEAR